MIQENLRKHKDVRFSSDYSNKNNNELENLSGDDFVGFDLCILSTRKTSLLKLNVLTWKYLSDNYFLFHLKILVFLFPTLPMNICFQ